MEIALVPQYESGPVRRVRAGDILLNNLEADWCTRFRFATAYIRMSGIGRLALGISHLIGNGGRISGAVGVDGITTIEALEALMKHSSTSTVFHTTSGFIFHPKLYLLDGNERAVAVIGSQNMTRDGLFRNLELGVELRFDLTLEHDRAIYVQIDAALSELLDTRRSNVQALTAPLITALTTEGLIKHESEVHEPGPPTRGRSTISPASGILASLFPPIRVPTAPPIAAVLPTPATSTTAITSSLLPGVGTLPSGLTFIMQLSTFDSSHPTGVRGTPEILIPKGAVSFFPPIASSSAKYPEVHFDVLLQRPTGPTVGNYRLWYYGMRAKGTKIDEHRLRLNHDTVDLATRSGGDLLIISRLPPGSSPAYEVTVLSPTDPQYTVLLGLCSPDPAANGKVWGIV